MLAMLCFAGMDAISKWLVADYSVAQMMWIRYILLCLFAWFVVRRQGLRATFRTTRPVLQIVRSLIAVVEGAMFVPKPYDLFKLGRLVQYLIVAKRTRAGAFA